MWGVGGSPCVIHCAFTLCHNLSNESPGLVWTFCARVIGEAHLTSSGLIDSIMSAAKSSSMASLRYARWDSVSCLWCGIFFGNVTPAGIWMQCSAPGIGRTSWTDRAKQSANSEIRSRTLPCWTFDRSEPIETCFNTSATRFGLCGSVAHVKSE